MMRIMALFRYFSSVDKPAKDHLGLLSRAVLSSSIASANAEVRGVLEIEERTTIIGAGKRGPYTKVSAELKAQLEKLAA